MSLAVHFRKNLRVIDDSSLNSGKLEKGKEDIDLMIKTLTKYIK